MLTDHRVLAEIIEAASISKNEKICEVGTGHGVLTTELCKHAQHVISYEVDRELFKQAQKEMHFQNLYLANADLFNTKEQQQQQHHTFDVFISNLPYSRSRDAFEWLANQKFDRAIVMVQKEFAEKIISKPSDKRYRAVSALSTYCFRIDKLLVIGRQSFEPQPRVESALIRLTSVKTITADTIKNLNLLFSQRNKKASTVAAKAGIKMDFGSKRIDQLEPNDLIKIAEAMK